MNLAAYRRLLAIPAVRVAVMLGVAARIPTFAGAVMITLHVVTGLGLSYTQAGLVTLAYTMALSVAGPWRGRILDRKGLRRTVAPSLLVMAVCWSVAPFVGYGALLVIATVAGLYNLPVFAVIRQAMMVAADDADRRTALSLDSVAVEVSFMIGPLLAVWAATTYATSWSLFAVQMGAVAAGVLIWVSNPPLRRAVQPVAHPVGLAQLSVAPVDAFVDDALAGDELVAGAPGEGSGQAAGQAPAAQPAVRLAPEQPRSWRGAPFWGVCLLASCATIVLTGTDLGLVAALRQLDRTPMLGVVLSVWGLGSAIGGLLYGALRRPVPATWLLFGLGVVTLPLAWAHTVPVIAAVAGVAGLMCAPVITATVDQLTRLVPESAHGEAIGWHGSFLTGGSALGAPLAGVAIDASGASAGFILIGLLGVSVGAAGALGGRLARRR